MHVERYGHGGAPVVLIHGFGTCSFLWRNVGPALAVTQHTAYAVDLLGYGESDRPFDADFGLAAQSDYLERALTALRVARAALVGVDIGAAVALRLAALRPERVARLVLINPIGGEDIPAGDIRAMQRNTARFALRVSPSAFGSAKRSFSMARVEMPSGFIWRPTTLLRSPMKFVGWKSGTNGASRRILCSAS